VVAVVRPMETPQELLVAVERAAVAME